MMRNVVDIARAFAEQRRVVKPGGRVVCLEITLPRTPVFGPLFRFYFFKIVPRDWRHRHRAALGLHLPAPLRAEIPTAARARRNHAVGWPARRALRARHARHWQHRNGRHSLGDKMSSSGTTRLGTQALDRRDVRRVRADLRHPPPRGPEGRARGRDAPGDEPGRAHDHRAGNRLRPARRRGAGQRRLPARRHRRGHRQRLLRDRRHDRRAVQHQEPLGHRQQLRRRPHHPRGRRPDEGRPPGPAHGARDTPCTSVTWSS